MLGRCSAGFLLGFSLLALGSGCRERGSADQDSRPLPTPEPPASALPATPRAEAPAAPKKPTTTDTKEPSKPIKVEPTEPAPPAATATASSPPAGAGAGGTSATPSPAASVPAVTAPSAACLNRCQGAMQGCLSQPVDGGVPGFANLDLCKKAFEACQSACQ